MATKKDAKDNLRVVKHDGLGIDFELPEEITQGALEVYEGKVADVFDDIKRVEIARLNRTVVEAAIAAGWLPNEEPIKKDVKDMNPAVVTFLAGKISPFVQSVRAVPGE